MSFVQTHRQSQPLLRNIDNFANAVVVNHFKIIEFEVSDNFSFFDLVNTSLLLWNIFLDDFNQFLQLVL